MGDNLGIWAKRVVQVVVIISLFGTNVSQIVASSSDAYYLEHGLSKRLAGIQWGLTRQVLTGQVLPYLALFHIHSQLCSCLIVRAEGTVPHVNNMLPGEVTLTLWVLEVC